MTEEFHYDKLLTLNNVYHHTLIQSNVAYENPVIRTPLYPHQATLVQGMIQHREKLTRGFVKEGQIIQGKLGIVVEPAGSGKTLSVLSYLASQPSIPSITSELHTTSSRYFFSHELKRVDTPNAPHLIIVPHILFGQWKEEIERHTSIPCFYVEMKRVLKHTDTSAQIRQSRVVLTTNKCYKFLQEYALENQIQWNNIVVDEAASIFFHASDPPLSFQFLWLVAQDWIPLLFKHPHISKSTLFFLRDRVPLHPDLERWLLDDITQPYNSTLASSFLKEYLPFFHPCRDVLFLRTGTEFRDKSMNLPPFIHETVACKSNITLNSLMSFYLARNREPAIRSNQIPQLFQALGIECTTIAQYLTTQPSGKLTLIRRKVQDNECGICLEPCEYPTIVNCCHHLYCGKCLLKNTILNHKCPTCRGVLLIPNLCCLSPFTADQFVARTKMEVCMELFRTNPKGSFIVFSPFTNIFYELVETMKSTGIKAERMENHLFSLRRTVRNLQEGTTQVVFVSTIDGLRGLSLPSTTHIIFYHEPSSSEWKELLIHSSQRLGRTRPLTLLHLNSEIPV